MKSSNTNPSLRTMSTQEQPSPVPSPVALPRKSVSPIKMIIVVVCCVAAAVVIAWATFGIVNNASTRFDSRISDAKVEVAKMFVNQSMRIPLETYRLQVGNYPSTAEGLQALIIAPDGKADRWRGPYVTGDKNKVFLDPWGNPYQYRYPGIHNKNGFDIWSKGPDGRDGTDDDIGNWSKGVR